MTLREYTEDILRLIELAENEDLDEQAIKDTLEGLEGGFENKAESYAHVINELSGDIEKIMTEIERLNTKVIILDNNRKRIKEFLKESMERVGKPKFKTDFYSFGIVKNGGKAPLIVTGNVPKKFYKKLDPVIDNEAIRTYLDTNPTCKWAHLGERGTHLSIR